MYLSREEKLQEIKGCVESDLLACDLKVSLFAAAAKSFKRNFLLNPFPSQYVKKDDSVSDVKDFERLVSEKDRCAIARSRFGELMISMHLPMHLLHALAATDVQFLFYYPMHRCSKVIIIFR
jgi:hypothetical protein